MGHCEIRVQLEAGWWPRQEGTRIQCALYPASGTCERGTGSGILVPGSVLPLHLGDTLAGGMQSTGSLK